MPISKSGKLYYTAEQAKEAAQCSALEYAKSRGYDLVPDGPGRYHLREHDSMVFLEDGRWFWNSQNLSGHALDFVQEYEGLNVVDAILTLTNDPALTGGRPVIDYSPKEVTPREHKPLVLPQKADTNRHLYGYLCTGRGIDREIIHDLIAEGKLYQSQFQTDNGKTIYNAVFVSLDDQGQPKAAFKRGLSSYSNYKREVTGSDKSWPFIMGNETSSATLVLTEAAIDAASFATVVKQRGSDWRECTLMATGGSFNVESIRRYLSAHPNIQAIGTAFDNDDAGQKFRAVVHQAFDGEYPVVDMPAPEGKDWNEYLTTRRSERQAVEKKNIADVVADAKERSRAANEPHVVRKEERAWENAAVRC